MGRIGIGLAIGVMAFGLLAISAKADDSENDRGRYVSKSYDFRDFTEIDVSGVYDLDVEVGPDFSISLSGHKQEMDRVEIEKDGAALVLGQKDESFWKRRGGNRKGVDAKLTMPSLDALMVSGVVDGEISGVDAQALRVKISGVGDVEIEGECDRLEASVSGVGDLDAKDLECREVEVSLSGVGDASVFASEAVDAKVSGVGDIDVYGSPSKVSKSGGMFSDITVR